MGGSGTAYSRKRGLTKDDLRRAINRTGSDNDSYIFDVEYQKLQKENEKLRQEYEKAREDYLRITEELRQQMSNGTASEADMARFMAVLTDEGVQLQQQQKELQDTLSQLSDQRNALEGQLTELRKNAFAGATHVPSQTADKDANYRGFKNPMGEAKVVEMTPAEYLRRVAFQFGNGNTEDLLKNASPSQIEKYARQMRRGIKFNSPQLNYGSLQAIGSQQVLAAFINGYQKIPVMVIE